MNNLLLSLNLVLILFILYHVIRYNISKIITSVTLVSYLFLYFIGLITIYFYPDIFDFEGVSPDYRQTYAFPLASSFNIIQAITIVNIGIFCGLVVTEFNRFKKLSISIRAVTVENRESIYLAYILLIFSFLYFLLFFFYSKSWPVFYLIKYNLCMNDAVIHWFDDQSHNPIIFYPSIMRQVLQVAIPLSLLYFLIYYKKNKKKIILINILCLFFVFYALLIGLFKNTPFILFSAQLVIFCIMSYRKYLKKIFLIIFSCFTVFFFNYQIKNYGMQFISESDKGYYRLSSLCDKQEPSSKQYEDSGNDTFTRECSQYFKTSKVQIDFSDNSKEKLRSYNFQRYSLKSPNKFLKNEYAIVMKILTRSLIGEMMDTYMIVSNKELAEYYRSHNPISGYIKKIFGLKTSTIYQDMAKILTNDLNMAGSVAISAFFEFYLLFDYYSIVFIALAILFLGILDNSIRNCNEMNRLKNYDSGLNIDPSYILLSILIPQLFLKGITTSFFTGGIFSIIVWLLFKSLFRYFFEKNCSTARQ